MDSIYEHYADEIFCKWLATGQKDASTLYEACIKSDVFNGLDLSGKFATCYWIGIARACFELRPESPYLAAVRRRAACQSNSKKVVAPEIGTHYASIGKTFHRLEIIGEQMTVRPSLEGKTSAETLERLQRYMGADVAHSFAEVVSVRHSSDSSVIQWKIYIA